MCRQLTIIAESLPVRKKKKYCRCGRTFQSKGAHEHTEADLTEERNPVSDKSCQLTEQAGKERREGQN